MEKYVQIVNRNIQKDEYKSLNVNKIQDKIVIGKNQSIQENEDIEEQKEYETFTTITNEDLQKKEENQLLAKIEKNKVYQTYQKIHHYSQLFIYNLRGGVNMNNMLDDFFKVGIYNVLNTVTKRFSQFQIEFGKYKQDIGTFPVRSDYFQLLYYKELNQNKVYNFKDQLRRIQFQNHYILQKERINESIDLYNYLIKNQITKSFVNINWIHPEHIDVNPTYNPNLITQCFCQDNKNQNSKVQCDAQIIIKVKQIDNQLIEYLKTTKSFIIERQASKQKPATTTTTTQIKNIQKYAFIE